MKLLPQFAESLRHDRIIAWDPISPQAFDGASYGKFYIDECTQWVKARSPEDLYEKMLEMSKYYGNRIITEEEMREWGKVPDKTPKDCIKLLEECLLITVRRDNILHKELLIFKKPNTNADCKKRK